MGKKKTKQRKYSPEFKVAVIMDMRENHLAYREAIRKHWHTKDRYEEGLYLKTIRKWERIFLEEGVAGFYIERHGGRKQMAKPKRKKQLDKEIEDDLIAENQRLKEKNQYLEAELEYLKKLRALVQAEEKKNGKKPK